MSEETQKPAPPEIRGACDHIDSLLASFLAARRKASFSRRFEAPVEVRCLLNLMLRYAESIITLAREDLVLLPAANVVARSMLEAGYRAMWLLDPVDPFEREARWLATIETAIAHYRKLSTAEVLSDKERQHFATRMEAYKRFSKNMAERCAAEGNKSVKLPNFREIAENSLLPDCYHLFVLLSAYTHSNFVALDLYRKDLGLSKEFGEFITPSAWALSLSVAGTVFYHVARSYLSDHDVDVAKEFPSVLLDDLKDSIASVVAFQ